MSEYNVIWKENGHERVRTFEEDSAARYFAGLLEVERGFPVSVSEQEDEE